MIGVQDEYSDPGFESETKFELEFTCLAEKLKEENLMQEGRLTQEERDQERLKQYEEERKRKHRDQEREELEKLQLSWKYLPPDYLDLVNDVLPQPDMKQLQKVRALFKYSRFRFQDEIRILRILPSHTEDPVECELFHTRLPQCICVFEHIHDMHCLECSGIQILSDYEAISYTWGNCDNDHMITVNGECLWVTSNCMQAVRRLRRSDEARLVWIDAICIDQDVLGERNHQIRLMNRIYRAASRVIIFLGEGNDLTDLAMKIIFSVALKTVKPHQNSEELPLDNLRAVLALLRRPWFSRIWVIQEPCPVFSISEKAILSIYGNQFDTIRTIYSVCDTDALSAEACQNIIFGDWYFAATRLDLLKVPNWGPHEWQIIRHFWRTISMDSISSDEAIEQSISAAVSSSALTILGFYRSKTYGHIRKTSGQGHSALYMPKFLIPCDKRRFFITSKGFFGLAPPEAQEDDIVCLFQGGRVPFLIREHGVFFKLVGECYVQQVMLGEEFTTTHLKEFKIV